MGPEDVFLLGVDLKKSRALLLPAYDDAQGVTAAFNLNLLHRMNRELGANFHVPAFAHVPCITRSTDASRCTCAVAGRSM